MLSGFLTDAIGVRGTVIVLGVPSAIIGGLLLINGSRFIRDDLALVVEELLEEREEFRRRGEQGLATPALQLANVDFSYGTVQVLFGIDLEVRQGETLALLGTNGAGKSTILRVVSGLATPERGVVRFRGQNITYVSPEARAKQLGIMLLPGGTRRVQPPHRGAEPARRRPAARARAAVRWRSGSSACSSSSPSWQPRRAQVAGKLSGGQQQMVALARVLVHEPEVLLIDELSLGLAPAVVERLLTLVEDLKARGQTMVIVEQSLNVALAVADRAIFLEKGEVRFEGPAQRAPRARRPRARRVLRERAPMTLATTILTADLLVKGIVSGLVTALLGMGIVLIHRSNRVVNFAAGHLGIPPIILFAVMAGTNGWPYGVALALAPRPRHRLRCGGGAHRHPPALPCATRDRARRHHRGGAARAGRRHHAAGLPTGRAAEELPAPVRGDVEPLGRASPSTPPSC